MMASIFKVKTDPNQAIKSACLRKKLYYNIFEIKEVSLAITNDLKIFPPIPRFRF